MSHTNQRRKERELKLSQGIVFSGQRAFHLVLKIVYKKVERRSRILYTQDAGNLPLLGFPVWSVIFSLVRLDRFIRCPSSDSNTETCTQLLSVQVMWLSIIHHSLDSWKPSVRSSEVASIQFLTPSQDNQKLSGFLVRFSERNHEELYFLSKYIGCRVVHHAKFSAMGKTSDLNSLSSHCMTQARKGLKRAVGHLTV